MARFATTAGRGHPPVARAFIGHDRQGFWNRPNLFMAHRGRAEAGNISDRFQSRAQFARKVFQQPGNVPAGNETYRISPWRVKRLAGIVSVTLGNAWKSIRPVRKLFRRPGSPLQPRQPIRRRWSCEYLSPPLRKLQKCGVAAKSSQLTGTFGNPWKTIRQARKVSRDRNHCCGSERRDDQKSSAVA